MLSDSISDQGSRTGVCPVSISKAMFYRCHDVVVGNGPPPEVQGSGQIPHLTGARRLRGDPVLSVPRRGE